MPEQVITIQGITVEQLRSMIREDVRGEIERTQRKSAPTDSPMTIQQVSEYIHKSVPTIYQLTSKRKIPFSKVGNTLLFSKKEIDAFIAAGRRTMVEDV